MTTSPPTRASRRSRLSVRSAVPIIALSSAGLLFAAAGTAHAVVEPVLLGTARTFVVLAGSGITNTGATTLNGDVGSYPNNSFTGSGTVTINGIRRGDQVTATAKDDLTTAYDAAAAQTPPEGLNPAVLTNGTTLTPGIYKSGSSIQVNGAITLDGGGDPDALFVFQAGSTLKTAPNSVINLTNGAQACNVFWQVGSSATLDTNTTFVGSVLALTSISLNTSTTVRGRVLARNGAVTLQNNTITKPTCSPAGDNDDTVPVGTGDDTTPDGLDDTPPPDDDTPPGGDDSTPGDDDNGDNDSTPGGDDNGDNDSTPGGDNGSDSDDQVDNVPNGAVDTGAYTKASGTNTSTEVVAGALMLTALGTTAVVVTRRRRRDA